MKVRKQGQITQGFIQNPGNLGKSPTLPVPKILAIIHAYLKIGFRINFTQRSQMLGEHASTQPSSLFILKLTYLIEYSPIHPPFYTTLGIFLNLPQLHAPCFHARLIIFKTTSPWPSRTRRNHWSCMEITSDCWYTVSTEAERQQTTSVVTGYNLHKFMLQATII